LTFASIAATFSPCAGLFGAVGAAGGVFGSALPLVSTVKCQARNADIPCRMTKKQGFIKTADLS